MRRSLAFAVLLLAGCVEHQRGFFVANGTEALNVRAPVADRCKKLPKGSPEADSCLQLKQTAVEWTRHLNTGDQICLENLFGDDPGAKCKARGVLLDSGTDGFLIEVRDSQMDSHWLQYNQRQVWFATGAMIDQYLKERGYE
jgi:hypothetical protein